MVDRTPILEMAEGAATLARKAAGGHLTESEATQRLPDAIGRHRQGDTARTHIAGLGQDTAQVQNTVVVDVPDGIALNGKPTGSRINHAGGLKQPLIQGCGHDERLERGTGLEQIDDSPIACEPRHNRLTVVGIERGLAHHGQDFTIAGIQDHHRADLGTMGDHCRLEFPVSQVLNPPIQAEL